MVVLELQSHPKGIEQFPNLLKLQSHSKGMNNGVKRAGVGSWR